MVQTCGVHAVLASHDSRQPMSAVFGSDELLRGVTEQQQQLSPAPTLLLLLAFLGGIYVACKCWRRGPAHAGNSQLLGPEAELINDIRRSQHLLKLQAQYDEAARRAGIHGQGDLSKVRWVSFVAGMPHVSFSLKPCGLHNWGSSW